MAVATPSEKHRDLVEELLAEVSAYKPEADRELITRAFRFAEKAHDGQLRRSGQDFIHHPFGVAQICAGLHLDEPTIAAALLHDTVEDTEVELEEIRAEFGEEIARLVDGVTKLTRISFQSREQAEAENYRRMIVAMAEDARSILIKLADRLHNMRTIEYLGKDKQVQKAKETLEVYAPLAHRLGVHAVKWELEDLSFATLHPRKYAEIRAMVNERRTDREEHVLKAGEVLQAELQKVDIPAEISGRAKHFYSIYDKMAKKGREFNEIYDLTAMRVIVERSAEEGTRDCYGALGLIHSLWKPMPGRFKDYIAMPKLNRYRSLHTTVIGPDGRPLEIQIRTREMDELARFGIAAHATYKGGGGKEAAEWLTWMQELMDTQTDESDPGEFMKQLRTDLFADEVYAFTPKGQVKMLPAGATPIDFAYAIHTDVGHRTVGAKVNGRIVPLTYLLQSGDRVEILTSKSGERGPSRDWLSLAQSSRARSKIRQWFSRETRETTEAKGREALEQALKAQKLPYRKLAGSAVLAQVIRESGYKKAEDFYLALGSGKLAAIQIVDKVLQRLKTDAVAEEETITLKAPKARSAVASENYGIVVKGVEDVLVRLAKCCTPVPGDDIVGYISLGKGITIHREDCPNVRALQRQPERFTEVEWDGGSASRSFLVQVRVDSWDRPRLLEDVARTFAEHGANIVSYGGSVEDQLAKNWYTAEVGDVKDLRALLTALRNIEAVFDAYRVTPS